MLVNHKRRLMTLTRLSLQSKRLNFCRTNISKRIHKMRLKSKNCSTWIIRRIFAWTIFCRINCNLIHSKVQKKSLRLNKMWVKYENHHTYKTILSRDRFPKQKISWKYSRKIKQSIVLWGRACPVETKITPCAFFSPFTWLLQIFMLCFHVPTFSSTLSTPFHFLGKFFAKLFASWYRSRKQIANPRCSMKGCSIPLRMRWKSSNWELIKITLNGKEEFSHEFLQWISAWGNFYWWPWWDQEISHQDVLFVWIRRRQRLNICVFNGSVIQFNSTWRSTVFNLFRKHHWRLAVKG